jgi:hypothetical protein
MSVVLLSGYFPKLSQGRDGTGKPPDYFTELYPKRGSHAGKIGQE